MRRFQISICIALMGLLTACSTPQEDAAKAMEEVARERLKLVDEYRGCVKEAASDKLKVEACDTYLRAAEALK